MSVLVEMLADEIDERPVLGAHPPVLAHDLRAMMRGDEADGHSDFAREMACSRQA